MIILLVFKFIIVPRLNNVFPAVHNRWVVQWTSLLGKGQEFLMCCREFSVGFDVVDSPLKLSYPGANHRNIGMRLKKLQLLFEPLQMAYIVCIHSGNEFIAACLNYPR